jgi:hypothetical protein
MCWYDISLVCSYPDDCISVGGNSFAIPLPIFEWSLPRKKYSQEYLKVQSWDPCSVCHLLMTSSDARLFADDFLLYRHVNSQNDSDLLQKDLSALEKWEEEWQMSFHPQKCSHQDSYKPTTCHTNTIHSTWSHSRSCRQWTKRARVSGLYLEVLQRVLLSRKTSLHLGAPAVSGY